MQLPFRGKERQLLIKVFAMWVIDVFYRNWKGTGCCGQKCDSQRFRLVWPGVKYPQKEALVISPPAKVWKELALISHSASDFLTKHGDVVWTQMNCNSR